jgi:hypothetical protein
MIGPGIQGEVKGKSREGTTEVLKILIADESSKISP